MPLTIVQPKSKQKHSCNINIIKENQFPNEIFQSIFSLINKTILNPMADCPVMNDPVIMNQLYVSICPMRIMNVDNIDLRNANTNQNVYQINETK